jgi:hypothetical protein
MCYYTETSKQRCSMKKFFLSAVFLMAGLLSIAQMSVANSKQESYANQKLSGDFSVIQTGSVIEITMTAQTAFVEIQNSAGVTIWSGECTNGQQINVTNWSPGEYMAKCDPRHGKLFEDYFDIVW